MSKRPWLDKGRSISVQRLALEPRAVGRSSATTRLRMAERPAVALSEFVAVAASAVHASGGVGSKRGLAQRQPLALERVRNAGSRGPVRSCAARDHTGRPATPLRDGTGASNRRNARPRGHRAARTRHSWRSLTLLTFTTVMVSTMAPPPLPPG